MDDLKLTVVTFNLEEGGWDHRNLDRLPDMLEQAGDVDVLLFQEGHSYEAQGSELLFRAESLLAPFGLRGFLTQSQRGRLHEIVFIRWPRLRPVRHYVPSPGTFREQVGLLTTRLEGLDRELVFKSVQWINWSGDLRLEEAQRLTRWAAPGQAVIIGGDFNSLWPDCRRRLGPWRPRVHREFEPDWAALPPHKRLHKSLQPGSRPRRWWSRRERLVSDRRALTVLAGRPGSSARVVQRLT